MFLVAAKLGKVSQLLLGRMNTYKVLTLISGNFSIFENKHGISFT